MSEDLTQQVKEEVARVSALPLEEQPSGFAAIRDQLERALNSDAIDSKNNEVSGESSSASNQGA